MARPYQPSPAGVAIHPWLNKPDIKYNADGVYKVDVAFEGDDATRIKADIDAAVETFFDEATKEMSPRDAKKWTKYHPYEVEEDEAGNPTGRLIVSFKQNAVLPLRDGSKKPFTLGLRDGAGQPTAAPIFGGAIIRVMWSPRLAKVQASSKIGARLDFALVQIIKPAESRGMGFDAVEGAWVDDGSHPTRSAVANETAGETDPSADY